MRESLIVAFLLRSEAERTERTPRRFACTALPAERRVLASRGWTGEKSRLFEHPMRYSPLVHNVQVIEVRPCQMVFPEPIRFFSPAECRVVHKSRNSWPDGQGNASIRNHGEASHYDRSCARFGGRLSGSLMGGLFSESRYCPRGRSPDDPSRWAKRDDLLQGYRLSRTQAALREAGEAHDGGLHREPRHCRARAHARQAGSGVCRSVDV